VLPVYPSLSPRELVERTTAQIAKWIVPLIETQAARDTVTPRVLLQIMGTEVFRAVREDTWIKAWMRVASRYTRVVAADCRFPNEAEALHLMQGYVWRVYRDGAASASGAAHATETVLEQIKPDAVVHNNGSIYELQQAVRSLAEEKGWSEQTSVVG